VVQYGGGEVGGTQQVHVTRTDQVLAMDVQVTRADRCIRDDLPLHRYVRLVHGRRLEILRESRNVRLDPSGRNRGHIASLSLVRTNSQGIGISRKDQVVEEIPVVEE